MQALNLYSEQFPQDYIDFPDTFLLQVPLPVFLSKAKTLRLNSKGLYKPGAQ